MGCLWHTPIKKKVPSEIAHVSVIEEHSSIRGHWRVLVVNAQAAVVTAASKIYVGVLRKYYRN